MPEKLSQGPRIGYDARVGAGLTRGPNLRRKLDAAAWAGTWPAPGSTLDLDFANNLGWVRGYGQGGVMDALTFTRASNATYVGSDGLLKGAGNHAGPLGVNLLTFPQDFDNAAWTKPDTTITANAAVAPDGTQTADLISYTTTGGYVTTGNITVTASGTYTFSAYVKGTAGEIVRILIRQQNGSSSSNAATVTLTGGWDRVSVTHTFGADNTLATPQFTNQSTAGYAQRFYAWGAQLETGSSATTYYPTNVNAPRFDWASTAVTPNLNLFTYTEQFDNAAWVAFGTASKTGTNVAVAPDGTTTADSIRVIAATSQIYQTVNLAANVTYTFSCYVMRNAASNQTFRLKGKINAATDTFSPDFTATSAWQRFSFTWTTNFVNPMTISIAGNTSGVQADLLVWGAQLEIGSSATAYQAISQPPTITPLVANSTCNGLLIEESRTNRALWCRDATNAAWVATNVSTAKDQTGIDGVANAASSITASADGGTLIQTVTLASGSRTGSVYLKRITGTGTVQVSLDGSTWSTVELSSTEWRRVVLSGTVTNPVVGIKLATNGDAVAMDYAQIEDNAGTLTTQLAATSPILTTSAAATRASEVAFISGAAFTSMNMDSPNKASMFAEFMPITLNNTSGNVAVISAENANQASIRLTCGTSNIFGLSYRIGTTIFGVNVPFDSNSALLQKQKTFVSWSNQRLSASRNNQQTNFSEVNGISANLIGWPMTSLGLSASQAGGFQSKYISRLVYWPYTQSDTALQEFAR